MLLSLPNALGDAATNMAIDLSLLETLPTGTAALRHYAWTEPSITFGYTQHYQKILRLADSDSTLCRRPTAGGIVDHRNDWTYALILNAELPSAGKAPTELYARVHQAIRTALESNNIESQLAPCPRACSTDPAPRSSPASECFISPAANDVLLPDGRKIAGAAMKRTRSGLLIQGSIDRSTLPDAFNYNTFQQQFLEALAQTMDLPIARDTDLRPLFNSPVIDQHRQKFQSEAWNRKR